MSSINFQKISILFYLTSQIQRLCFQGVFVAFVHKDSPAALAGLRFGDQILQIDGDTVAGWDTDKAMKVLKNANAQKITMAIRDR